MRVLFTVSGGLGHLYPLVPLARALAESGAETAVAAPAYCAESVAAVGLMPIPLDAAGVSEQSGKYKAEQAARDQLGRGRAAVDRYLEQAVLQTPELCSAARIWDADVIVRETTAYAGWLAGALLDLPVAVFDFAPRPQRLVDAALGDLFGAARARVGLPVEDGTASLTRWLHLVAAPPGWLPASLIGPTTHVFQPPTDPPYDGDMPAYLARMDHSKPLVYATLGTMVNQTPGMFEAVLTALADQPVNVLATVGKDVDPRVFAGVREGVVVERFVPQDAVLRHADAMICHGGYGSVMGAMRHGVPVVAIILADPDSAVNAFRLEAAGAGVMLPEARQTVGDIRRAVAAVLGQPRYRAAAEDVARSIAEAPPLHRAAPLIARLATERAPIHHDLTPTRTC